MSLVMHGTGETYILDAHGLNHSFSLPFVI